jgi:NAD(P)-dependent dehydrogenase (short-subunit alcohol dehydrogenase family)
VGRAASDARQIEPQCALIIGYRRGLSAAIIKRYTALGGGATLVVPSTRAANDAERELDAQPEGGIVVSAFPFDRSEASRLVAIGEDQLGGLTSVVFLPTIPPPVPAVRLAADWLAPIDEALSVFLYISQAYAGEDRIGGAVTVLAGVDARHSYPARLVSSTIMCAVMGMVRSLAVEFAHTGIRFNAVLAGPVADGGPTDDLKRLPSSSRARDRTEQRTPMQRPGTPAEVASAVVFVGSSRASYMTGQSLRVDGGWMSLNQAPTGMDFPLIPLDGRVRT